jgi:hypothetical protein
VKVVLGKMCGMLSRDIRGAAQERIDKRVDVSRKVESDFRIKRQLVGGYERDRTSSEQGGDMARAVHVPICGVTTALDGFAPEAESTLLA